MSISLKQHQVSSRMWKNFDSAVKLWKKEAEDKISAIQVGIHVLS